MTDDTPGLGYSSRTLCHSPVTQRVLHELSLGERGTFQVELYPGLVRGREGAGRPSGGTETVMKHPCSEGSGGGKTCFIYEQLLPAWACLACQEACSLGKSNEDVWLYPFGKST